MNRLRELREQQGLSLRELGLKVNMNASVLGNYERGDRQPKTEVWDELANFFDVPTPYIMGLTDVKIDPSHYLLNIVNSMKEKKSEQTELLINDKKYNNSWAVMNALQTIMDYLEQPDEEQAKIVTDTMIQAITLVGNIAHSSNKKDSISLKDLHNILININSTYMRSASTETLYSKEKSIQKHLESLNEITNILNAWYMESLDKKRFNQTENNAFE